MNFPEQPNKTVLSMAFAYPRSRQDELEEPAVQSSTPCPKCQNPMVMGLHTGQFVCDECDGKPIKKRGRPRKNERNQAD